MSCARCVGSEVLPERPSEEARLLPSLLPLPLLLPWSNELPATAAAAAASTSSSDSDCSNIQNTRDNMSNSGSNRFDIVLTTVMHTSKGTTSTCEAGTAAAPSTAEH